MDEGIQHQQIVINCDKSFINHRGSNLHKSSVMDCQSLGKVNESISAFASAYSLGEKESAAAINLLKNIPDNIREYITELVRFLSEVDVFSMFLPQIHQT